jgi:hypothetical protein
VQNCLYLVSDLRIRAIIVVSKDILKRNGGSSLNKEEKDARNRLLHVYHHRCTAKSHVQRNKLASFSLTLILKKRTKF